MPNNLFSPINSPAYNELVANLQNLCSQGNFQSFRDLLGADQPTSTIRYSQTAADDDTPGFICAVAGNFSLCCCNGVNRLAHATKLINGYAVTNILGQISSVPDRNTYVTQYATRVEAELARLGRDPQIASFFIGHSLGGAAAEALATFNFDAGYQPATFCTSFGSPKWGVGIYTRGFFRLAHRRWMNDTDPVPLLPFTASLVPSLVTQWTFGFFDIFERQGHLPGGVVLSPGGGYEAGVIPPNVTIGNVVSMAGWLFNVESNSIAGHGMAEYWSRLRELLAFSRQPLAGRITAGPAEGEGSTDTKEIRQIEARVATIVSNQQAAQNQIPLEVPAPRLFTVKRNQRLFMIVFGGQTVGITSDRRTARSLCRQFNTALRHLQTTAFVNTETLTQQFADYLTAAADPSGAFRPPMKTTLPV